MGWRTGSSRPARRQGGFTYLAVLALVAMLSAVAAATADVWHTAMQRENERQLLFIGDQFRMAINRYYYGSPGQRHYPASLDDLIKDPRFPDTRRYLRRIWPDPITNQADWEFVRAQDGGIVGVYSPSKAQPIKVANFDQDDGTFAGAEHYADWVFMAGPTQTANTAPASNADGSQQNNTATQQRNNTDIFGSDVFGAPAGSRRP